MSVSKWTPDLPFGFRVTQNGYPHQMWGGNEYRPDVGCYTGTGSMEPPPAPVPIECPYCHGLLLRMAPRSVNARIVRILREDTRGRYGLEQPIPPTHEPLLCVPCFQVFTVLKDVLDTTVGAMQK